MKIEVDLERISVALFATIVIVGTPIFFVESFNAIVGYVVGCILTFIPCFAAMIRN